MKKLEDIRKIAVIGAGTMGAGIAQISAMAGYEVILNDLDQPALDKAMAGIGKNLNKGIEKGKVTEAQRDEALSRLSTSTDFADLKADLILEAIIERLDVKVDLFQRLAAQNEADCILATNTSSIPITQIAREIPQPERVVGMHFFNPAHIMKLVEVIKGAATADQVAEVTKALAEKLGKKAVLAKDAPGFIVNRVARHFYVESLKVLEENVTDHAGIDRILESTGFRMGPFKLMDLIGVDTNLSVTTSMFESFNGDGKFRPSRIQQQKVAAGHNGRKNGRGFYDYSD